MSRTPVLHGIATDGIPQVTEMAGKHAATALHHEWCTPGLCIKHFYILSTTTYCSSSHNYIYTCLLVSLKERGKNGANLKRFIKKTSKCLWTSLASLERHEDAKDVKTSHL